MSSGNTAVFGLYPDENEVAEAIGQLERTGFRTADLSILLPENLGTKDLGHEKHTKAPEGAVAGGIAGAILGGVLAYLVNTGVIPIPADVFAQSMISANPVLAVLAGMGAFIVLCAIAGALIGAAQPEYEARRYDGRVRCGNVLLSVHCDDSDWRVRAMETLRRTGARGIACETESKADFGASRKPAPRLHTAGTLRHRTFLGTTPEATPAPVVETPPVRNSSHAGADRFGPDLG